MAPSPLIISLLLGVSAVAGSVGFALDPKPYSEQSALLITIGLVALTLATVSGVLLARGRWSRWMSLVVAALWFMQGIIRSIDLPGVATIVAAVAAASIAAGPWLGRWLRRLPAVDAPPPAAAILLLLLTGTPALIGFAAGGSTPGPAGWILTAWSWLLALGLARAATPALWAGRFGHGPISVAGGLVLGLSTGSTVLIKAAIEVALLWRRDLHLAVSPLLPQRASIVAIPPELMNPAVLEAAGLDDRGRPLEDS